VGALENLMAKQEAAPVAQLAKAKPKTLYGEDAIRKVSANEGRELSLAERRVVMEEGFVDGEYLDTKGIRTGGVGQTGEWMDKSFGESFQHHKERARKRVPRLDELPEALRAELIQAEYRGDLGLSPTAVKHLNAGNYKKASVEFLNNDEYRNPNTSTGIKSRMKAVADALSAHR